MDARSPLPGPGACAPDGVAGHRRPAPPVGASTALTTVLTATGLAVRSPAACTTVSVAGLGPAGRLLLLVPAADTVARAVRAAEFGELVAQVEASAVTPAALPDRLLARVWLRGTLAEVRGPERGPAARALAARAGLGAGARRVVDVAPGETVLRLTVSGGDLVDGSVRTRIGEAEWRAARLDPVADCSAGLVAHLLADHQVELAALARVVAGVLPAGAAAPGRSRSPVLVAVDRAGTRWRCATRGGAVDARLDFPAPLQTVRDLHPALRGLAHAAGLDRCTGRPCGLHDCRAPEARP